MCKFESSQKDESLAQSADSSRVYSHPSAFNGTRHDLRQCFSRFAAAVEPSANVCVAHGTLCNDQSVCRSFCNKQDG